MTACARFGLRRARQQQRGGVSTVELGTGSCAEPAATCVWSDHHRRELLLHYPAQDQGSLLQQPSSERKGPEDRAHAPPPTCSGVPAVATPPVVASCLAPLPDWTPATVAATTAATLRPRRRPPRRRLPCARHSERTPSEPPADEAKKQRKAEQKKPRVMTWRRSACPTAFLCASPHAKASPLVCSGLV